MFSFFAKDRKGSTAVDPSRRGAAVLGALPFVLGALPFVLDGSVRRSRRGPAEG